MTNKSFRKIPLIALLASAATLEYSYAEEIVIPIASQSRHLSTVERPSLGQQQQQVRAEFGEPEKTHPAIGTPAISRWDYPLFSVYFENGLVLHSVLKHRRSDENSPRP